jgi:diguanylate cyclase (GGDEF)-like protein
MRTIAPPMMTGVLYLMAALIVLHISRGGNGIATLWPSSGILFAALLVASPHRGRWHVWAAAAASLVANVASGNTPVVSLGFTLANITEAIGAVWLLRTRARRDVTFHAPNDLTWFCIAAIFGTSISASIATIIAPAPGVSFWFSWFATDLLGVLVVTPLFLMVGQTLQRGMAGLAMIRLSEISVVLAMVALVASFTFWQSTYPLLFLPMLAVIIAAYRVGPLGAAGGVLIIATVSSILLTFGYGPRPLLVLSMLQRNLFMQFYLLTLFAAALPIAALLAARAGLVDELAEKVRLLQLSEGAAHVGHWRVDTATREIAWSPEVFRIHGVAGDTPPGLDAALQAFHIDDRDLVSNRIGEAIRDHSGFAFTARIVRPNGEMRQVFLRGETDTKNGPSPLGLFGIMQDITDQVANEVALNAARVRAEAAAAQATILAQTDQLTGIANRRRTTLVLDEAVQASSEHGTPVSIATFDIDHFKRINDTYGHQAGDEVIKRVALDASGELRSADTLGRFGGEEFLIVLPGAIASVAVTVAERVRTAIESSRIHPSVTISIGVAELACGETCESLLRRADQALYEAKRRGRNVLQLAA